MIDTPAFADHIWALVVLLVASAAPGSVLVRLAPRLRGLDAWCATLLLGAAYWSAAAYLLPFRGGLLLAGTLAAAALCTLLRKRQRAVLRLRSRRAILAAAVLVGGAFPYLTPLWFKYVPDGMDASRYMVSTRLITEHGRIPESWAPFAPQIPFGSANHGAAVIAAVADAAGATSASAVLAVIPLTFASLIAGLFLVLRLAARRVPAAIMAVALAWLANQAQRTLDWGGFPEVLALAVGLLALRLLVDTLRGKGASLSLPLGLCVAAMPLLHGCIAAGWLHVLAPLAAVVGLRLSRRWQRGLGYTGSAAVVAGVILAAYLLTSQPILDDDAKAWIRANELDQAPQATGFTLLRASAGYLLRWMGRFPSLLLVAALFVLAFKRRFAWFSLVVAALLLNALMVANARHELLPTTWLLYPTRLRELPLVVLAVALLLAWRALQRPRPVRPRVAAILATSLLVAAATHHWRYYQRVATQPVIGPAAWRVLTWARANLPPEESFVAGYYGAAGVYLPGVAGIAFTDAHYHIADQYAAGRRMAAERPITHVLLIERDAIRTEYGRDEHDRLHEHYQQLIDRRLGTRQFGVGPVRLYRLGP